MRWLVVGRVAGGLGAGCGGDHGDLGAPATLLVSFTVLGVFWRTPRLEGTAARDGRPLPDWVRRFADARATRVGLRVPGLLLALVTVAVAALGPNTSGANPAPTWLYVWFWVGLVPASLLLGPIWRLLNPLRTISAGLSRLAGDPDQRHARARGDAFEVYSTLIAPDRPPVPVRPAQRWAPGPAQSPDRAGRLRPEPGLVAVVCTLLGSTAFDGLSRTRWWTDLTLDLGAAASTLAGTAGLLACVGIVAVTYTAATRAARQYRRARPDDDADDRLERQFVHSLVPILIGYTIAHYFSLLLFQGQMGYILGADPFDRGWDLFGTADRKMNLVLISTSAIALIQVGAIVFGHILGVVAAHDRAIALFRGRDTLRAQTLLLATMVFYTLSGIALLVGT